MASMLPTFMVVATTSYPDKGHVYYKAEDNSVLLGEKDVFSTLVKIQVERATINTNYVNLRFDYSNRYWALSANGNFIIAESKQPKEDTTNPACTLFEPARAGDNGAFTLKHVQSGGRLLINQTTWMFYVEVNPPETYGHLTCVDWATLVKLPPHIALKGDNGDYLKAYINNGNRLQFGSDDADDVLSGHRVTLMPDGHVRIFSDHYKKFWWMAEEWIYGDWSDHNGITSSLFWPVKIDETTIALRCAANNQFCKRLTTNWITSCLAAAVGTITREARLEVQELVSQRKIYYVRYRMEDVRIFNETPYLAGTARLTNITDQEASMSVSITYQDEKSYTFSRSVSITAGVSTTIQAGVPLIAGGEIEVSFEINTTLQWDTTKTTTTSVTASGTVPVPARSSVLVDYVGTRGTCNIPYSYTQEDRSSTSGAISRFDQVDGIYNGVSCYNFDFQVRQGSHRSI